MPQTMIHTDTFRLTTGGFDRYDRIRPFCVFDIFQVAAFNHAEKLGQGYRHLLKDDLVWILLRTKYVLLRQPKAAVIAATTWPLQNRRFEYIRQYELSDDEVFAYGTSIWCVLNRRTKVIRREPLDFPLAFATKNWFEEGFPKVPAALAPQRFVHSHTVRAADIDHNQHMNNARYADVILNALDLPPTKMITKTEIDFVAEALCADVIDVFVSEIENDFLLTGKTGGRTVFRAVVATTDVSI